MRKKLVATAATFAVLAFAAVPQIIPTLVGTLSKPTLPATTLYTSRINAGGSAYTDASNNVWAADNSTEFYSVPDTITGTTDQPIYQSESWAAVLTYPFIVPNGTYTVTLKFAEIYFGSAGQRIFNIDINGTRKQTGLDIVAEVGTLTALDKIYSGIVVTGGSVNVVLTGTTDNAKLSGIEVRQTAAGSGGGGGTPTLESLVGANNVNTPAPPAASGGYTGGGTAFTFSACAGGSGDDTAAVQAAINGLSSGGGSSLKMTCKANIGSAGITIANKSNIKFWGTGMGTGLKATATTGLTSSGGFAGSAMIKVSNCTDCLITNLEFDSNGIAVAAFLLDSTSRTELNGNYMHDTGCSVVGSDCYPSAILSGDGNTNARYIGNTLSFSGSCGVNCNGVRGAWLRETGTLFWGNTVHGTGGTAGACNCRDVTYAYNYMYDAGAAGFKLSGAGGPPNQNVGTSTYHHNLLNNTTQMMRLEETATTSVLVIRDNEARNMISDGIYANNSPMNNTQILHNNFHDISGTAVKLLSGLSTFLVQDNIMYSNGIGVHIGEVGGTFSGITLSRNDIRNNTIGIKLQNNGGPSIGLAVTGNSITGGNYGLNIDAGISGSISQSGNCWINTTNISDGRGVFSNPASSGSCSNPILP